MLNSKTCHSCFHNQELNKLTNSHARLIAEFFVHLFQPKFPRKQLYHLLSNQNYWFSWLNSKHPEIKAIFLTETSLKTKLCANKLQCAIKELTNWRQQIVSCKQTHYKTDSTICRPDILLHRHCDKKLLK